MTVKGKTVQVGVAVVVVAVAVGGRKLWPAICRRESLIVQIIAVAATVTTVMGVIPALLVMVEGLVMLNPQL